MEKILIVDDNTVNRNMLCKILQDEYITIEAANGKEALDILFKEGQFIVAVMLDIIMPEMDGFQVLKEIRNHKDFSELPIIIQTENTDEVFEMNALKLGATDFVVKPYRPEIIRTRLKNVIDTRKVLNQISMLSADEITGLMSLNEFYYEGAKWIKENPDSQFDVVAMDVVHFTAINDSKGVDGGNQILRTIAARIRELQKQYEFIAARVYADRFIMLIKRSEGYLDRLITEADSITAEYANRINVHLRYGIYEIVEKEIRLANFSGRAFSAIALIKDYYGNRYAYYDENLHNLIIMEEHINDEMEAALQEKQFQVYFQPKFDIFTNSIAGAEALVRWIHPVDGVISPAEFIPIFEKNGFIVKLDQYVWDMTALEIASWIKKGCKVVPVSVNISRVDIETLDVITIIEGIVHKYDILPELLHLEITETAYMHDTDKIISVVNELKSRGFIIEMDDFGSGYSSLNMLAKLPINILKLDMKFIQAIESSTNAKTIIEYTIGLAKWMNLPVIAEGVETEEQLELLRKLECNYVQGYIFAKPMPEEQFTRLLEHNDESIHEEIGIKPEADSLDMRYKCNMLIVDDLILNRSIIRSYFADSFNISEKNNGREAMEYLDSGKRTDIIILDIYMPEMDGYEMLKLIRADERYRKIPVLVISAGSQSGEEQKAFEMGADAFAAKPFTSEEIINKVRILLRAYNVLEDMSIWDLKDTIYNPWIKDMCQEIAVIRRNTGHICKISGNEIQDTADTYEKLMTRDIYEKCNKKVDIDGKMFSAYYDKLYIINVQKIKIKNEEYLLCFKVGTNNAEHVQLITMQ